MLPDDLFQSVKLWKELYRLHPRATLIATILLAIGGSLVLGAVTYYSKKSNEELVQKRQENLTYNQQLEALNNVQGSLNNLIQFVEAQKTKLKESENLINSLKTEQEKLKPVVEADRKTVEALVELQVQRLESNVWKERTIGFLLGFVSSILASLAIYWLRSLLRRRTSPPPPAAPATGS